MPRMGVGHLDMPGSSLCTYATCTFIILNSSLDGVASAELMNDSGLDRSDQSAIVARLVMRNLTGRDPCAGGAYYMWASTGYFIVYSCWAETLSVVHILNLILFSSS